MKRNPIATSKRLRTHADDICQALLDGETAASLARRHHVSREAIRRIAQRHGLVWKRDIRGRSWGTWVLRTAERSEPALPAQPQGRVRYALFRLWQRVKEII